MGVGTYQDAPVVLMDEPSSCESILRMIRPADKSSLSFAGALQA